MSQENVEVVERILNPPENFAGLVRDDERWRAWVEDIAPFFHPDWVTVRPSAPGDDETRVGFAGSRALWLGWVGPWRSYRVVFEQAIDWGERVLALSHDRALPAPAGVRTFRDRKIARFEIYEHRAEALKAVGLQQ